MKDILNFFYVINYGILNNIHRKVILYLESVYGQQDLVNGKK